MTADWKARPESDEYEQTRARVVACAEQVVVESGVAALRLDAVASAAGLSRSSLYRYVDSKEALIREVVIAVSTRAAAIVTADLDPDDPAELLVEGIVRSMAVLAEDPVHQSLNDPTNSAAMSRIASSVLVDAMTPLVSPMIAAAERRGVLRAGVTPDDATRWILVVASGLSRHQQLAEPDELRRLLHQMLVPVLLDE